MLWNLIRTNASANSLLSQPSQLLGESSIPDPKKKEVKIKRPSKAEKTLNSLVGALELAERVSKLVPPPANAFIEGVAGTAKTLAIHMRGIKSNQGDWLYLVGDVTTLIDRTANFIERRNGIMPSNFEATITDFATILAEISEYLRSTQLGSTRVSAWVNRQTISDEIKKLRERLNSAFMLFMATSQMEVMLSTGYFTSRDANSLTERLEPSPPPDYALTSPQTVSDISVETVAENNEEENTIPSNEERAVAHGFVADDGGALQIGGGDFDLFSSEDATLAKATGRDTTVELEATYMSVVTGMPRPTGNNPTPPNRDTARAVGFIATEGAKLRATRNNVNIRSYGKATFARASGRGSKMVITGARAEIHAGLPRS